MFPVKFEAEASDMISVLGKWLLQLHGNGVLDFFTADYKHEVDAMEWNAKEQRPMTADEFAMSSGNDISTKCQAWFDLSLLEDADDDDATPARPAKATSPPAITTPDSTMDFNLRDDHTTNTFATIGPDDDLLSSSGITIDSRIEAMETKHSELAKSMNSKFDQVLGAISALNAGLPPGSDSASATLGDGAQQA